MPTITLRTPAGSAAVSFTFEGAELGDATPAGAALALLAAQFEQDREKCLRLLSAASRAMVPPDGTPPAPFFGDVVFHVDEVAGEGERATVRLSMRSEMTGGQPMPNAMACVREDGAWRVDLMATMALAMSAMQDVLGTAQQGFAALDQTLGDLNKLLADLGGKAPGKESGAAGASQ